MSMGETIFTKDSALGKPLPIHYGAQMQLKIGAG